MGEWKVLNKYYLLDFDLVKIFWWKQLKNLQIKVWMMFFMSIWCNMCGNYIYKGIKFNLCKEDVDGEVWIKLMSLVF